MARTMTDEYKRKVREIALAQCRRESGGRRFDTMKDKDRSAEYRKAA